MLISVRVHFINNKYFHYPQNLSNENSKVINHRIFMETLGINSTSFVHNYLLTIPIDEYICVCLFVLEIIDINSHGFSDIDVSKI
jgi:hypothetical protein